jgi:hypothetical protein
VPSRRNGLGVVLAPVFVVLATFTLREKDAQVEEGHDTKMPERLPTEIPEKEQSYQQKQKKGETC